MERKEQEVTARNAQVHQQKLGTLQGFITTKNNTDEQETSANDAEGNYFNVYALYLFNPFSCKIFF